MNEERIDLPAEALSEEAHAALHAAGIPHAHGHGRHTHTHENTKAVINRLSRAIGHLQDHLRHCIVEAAQEGDQQAIDDICRAIDKFMK